MNKYELALVVNAKLEEEERAAVVEKAKGYVTRYGGTVGEVEEWGKKRLAYEIQHMREAYYYFIQFEADATAPAEIESLPWGARLMTLECGMRFLADFLQGDVYFKIAYPEHNLVRARTQFRLVKEMEEQFDEMNTVLKKYV